MTSLICPIRLMDPNDKLGPAGPLNIELEPMDTFQSPIDLSESSVPNMTVGSMPTDLHSMSMIEYDTQTGKTIYQCGKCEKKLESKDLLDKHLLKAHPSYMLMYKCPLCPLSVRYRKQHMRAHHVVKYDAKEHHYLVRYKCHCCSKLFQRKRNLLAHQNSLSNPCGRCQMRFKTKESLQAHMATHRGKKPFECVDCGCNLLYQRRFEEHRRRYHSRTSTEVVKTINCPYCPQMFIDSGVRKRHIWTKHVKSEFKVNCGHCPVQVTDTVLLRKHYEAIHPGERVTFKCPECAKFYLRPAGLKDHHYRKHRKLAGADNKSQNSITSEAVEGGLKESGRTNGHYANSELVSIVVKEEAVVGIGNAAVSGVSATTRIKDSSLNTNESSEQRLMVEINQEPLDNGEAPISTDLTEWEKSTATEGAYEQKSAVMEEHHNALSNQCGRCQMRFKTKESLQAHMATHRGKKPFECVDCGCNLHCQRRLEEHRKRYHSPTSTEVVKTTSCPYCPQLFIDPGHRKRHIAAKHVKSEFKVNCGRCPVQVTDPVLLRKHYEVIHPGERVTFKCTECAKFYLRPAGLKDHHYRKHRKVAGADNKSQMSITSEAVEDGLKESGRTNDHYANSELVSIAVKEEAVIGIGNATVSGVSATTRIKDSSLNTNESSEQRLMVEINQEPLDNGEAPISTDLTEWEKSTATEGAYEQKSAVMEEHHNALPNQCGRCQMRFKTKESLQAHMATHRGKKPFECVDCGCNLHCQRRLEEHRQRYHSPTSTEVVKTISCPYCPQLFIDPGHRKRHIAAKHVKSEFKVNCGRCPVQVTDTVLLRKHYEAIHPGERVKFKCTECAKFYWSPGGLKDHHYKKHRKEAGAGFTTKKGLQVHMATPQGKKSLKCEGCGLFFHCRDRLEDHWRRYHSPTSTEVLKIINCPYCPKFFTQLRNLSRHIAVNHEQNKFKVNCAHCPVQVTNAVLLKKHYKTVHPEKQVTFKCPECEMFDRYWYKYKDHYRKHRQEAEADEKEEVHRTTQPVVDGVVESGQTNDQNADGELVSIVFKEEAIVQIENAVVSGMMMKIKQEPLDNGEVVISTDLAEWEKSTATEGTCQQKSALMEGHQKGLQPHMAIQLASKDKPLVCKDCALSFCSRRRLEDHRKRYHSPTSTEVLKIINCPDCPKFFTQLRNLSRHIAANHEQNKFTVNCAHCPLQVTDTVLLRKHYMTVHPEKQVTFKCPECEKVYQYWYKYKDHYRKHRQKAEADEKEEVHRTTQPVVDGVVESGQTNDQNADGELVSIVIKEEAIVQIENAVVSGVMMEIKQEPLDNGEVVISTDLTEWEKSTTTEGTCQEKSALMEGHQKGLQPHMAIQLASKDKPLVKDHPSFTLMYKCPLCSQSVRCRKQHMRVLHDIDYDANKHNYLVRYTCHCCLKRFQSKHKLVAHLNAIFNQCGLCQMRFKTKQSLHGHMATHRSTVCKDCALSFGTRRRLEEHRKRYHSPTSTEVLKIINCPYCSKVFTKPSSRNYHIAANHEQNKFKVNCAHCPVQVTDTVLLRKHYKTVHPEKRVMFKCPECEMSYRYRHSFKNHYEKHMKEAGAHDKAEMNSTSEPVEDGMKESGQTNNQNEDGESKSNVIKEESIVQIGKAASGVSATAGIEANLSNTNESSKHMEKDHSKVVLFECPSCDASFTTESRMVEHNDKVHVQLEIEYDTQREKAIYPCGKCELKLESKHLLDKHLLMTHPSFTLMYKCPLCPHSVRYWKEHTQVHGAQYDPKKHHYQVRYKCHCCSKLYQQKRNLLAHQNARSNQCRRCQMKFKTKKSLQVHVTAYRCKKSFKCEDCGWIFYDQSRLEPHRNRYHSPTSTQVLKIINCPYCPKLFISPTSRSWHIEAYHEQIKFKVNCAHCPVQVTNAVLLKKHYKTVHPEKRVTFKCPECDVFYRYRHSFKNHYKSHTKEAGADDKAEMNSTSEPVEDGMKESGQTNNQNEDGELKSKVIKEEAIIQIGKAASGVSATAGIEDNSSSTNESSKHMEKDHLKIALFKCPSCDASFTTESRMVEHNDKVHVQLENEYDPQTGKTIYPCGKCEQKLESKHLLDKHLVKTHPSFTLMYKCPLCSQSVRYWKEHTHVHGVQYDPKIHHYQVRYKCHCCSKLFQQKGNLLAHQNACSNQCGRCQMRFKTKKSLQVHMTARRCKKSFKCEDCALSFNSRIRLEVHRNRYHSPTSTQVVKIINCPYCPKLFVDPACRSRHIADNHEQSGFKVNCAHCPVQVTNAVLLRKHYKTVHPEERVTYKCPECDVFYRYWYMIKDHYKKHMTEAGAGDNALFKCPSCDASFTTESRMVEHNDKVHVQLEIEYDTQREKAIYPCGKCELKLESKDLLDKHLLMTHPSFTLMYKCPLCPHSVRYWKEHTQVHGVQYDPIKHHYQVRYKCHCCSKLYQQKRNLLAHQNARSNQCRRCQMKFKTKKSLQVHMAARRCKKSFKCEDCGWICYDQPRLDAHRNRYHSPTSTQVLKIINCPYCPKLFIRLASLKSHIVANHEPNEFKVNCAHCPVQVTKAVLLRKHYKTVHPEEQITYKCPECDVFCRYRHNFNNHYKTHTKEAGADDKAEMNSTSEPVEDEMKESGQTNNQNEDGELKSKVIKEKVIVHIGKAASGVSAITGIEDNSPNTNESSKHMEKDHPKIVLFKCPSCDASFTTEAGMAEHNDKVHGQLEIEHDPQTGKTIYPCGKCELKLESKHLLDKHLVETHPSFTLMYKCPLCSQSVRCWKEHTHVHGVEYDPNKHHYQVRYKCHCCSKLYQRKQKLLDHQNALSQQCGRCQMRFETKKSFQAHMAIHQANKSFKCEDCGCDFVFPCRLREHRERFHSPTSTQVRKIICPYCSMTFIMPHNLKRHIAAKHVPSAFKFNCAHCPAQKPDSKLLRRHYKKVHPEELFAYKCPKCEKSYLHLQKLRYHYKKHNKETEANDKADTNSASESVEDEVNESGQTNDQTADAELGLIAINEEAIVQSEPVEDRVNDQHTDGELESIVVKEEAIVQIENGTTPTRIRHNSLNINEPADQVVDTEVKQEPLDNFQS